MQVYREYPPHHTRVEFVNLHEFVTLHVICTVDTIKGLNGLTQKVNKAFELNVHTCALLSFVFFY